MYRVLRRHGEVRERRRQAVHPPRKKPELIATAPNRVWSWDITKLKGPYRGSYFCLYTIIDIYSRYTVGWMISASENKELAEQFLSSTITKYPVGRGQLTIHSDRGSAMIAHNAAQMLSNMGVTKSHSRPKTSNDNPYSESQYKTLKCRHDTGSRWSRAATRGRGVPARLVVGVSRNQVRNPALLGASQCADRGSETDIAVQARPLLMPLIEVAEDGRWIAVTSKVPCARDCFQGVGTMLDGLHSYAIGVLITAVPVLVGALLFIWRDVNLRRRGVVVRAKCVESKRTDKGTVRLRLLYEVEGVQYYCDSLPFPSAPVGVGQRLDVIYDAKTPGYSEVVHQRTSGWVPKIVGTVAVVLLVLTGISYL
ncbi:DDE-type integrase/transposase/recombinase [Streptomyces sp. NBC_00569]|nr:MULTISPECIES: DDE-type integrase/transposase/recombinase [unclassified Streptomyces]MCX5443763.1 DDE-type integrase/transposase/recombinase [Streptomyces sp. NBC_00063]WUB90897.1 DDE-type integrase/transposase/recombinase [Streptomyces sp. NBC_00569]WUB99142.1 DDE-type integrase/transposase/recombinase [Streptomyces sp. NBC_00569]